MTIIDQEGRDLGLRMYGTLEWVGKSLLKGLDINGRPLYWDRRYNTYYNEEPKFERVGGIEMAKLKAGYVLRKYPTLVKPTRKQDIYYNHRIVWMENWLIIKRGFSTEGEYIPLRILSYGFHFFYVKSESNNQPSVTILDTQGDFKGRTWAVPAEDDHRIPLWRNTKLTNAYTGKEGFLDR